MSFPAKLAEALDALGLDVPAEGWFARQTECVGAAFHSPTPLVVRDVYLSPDAQGESALLCATCADNLGVLLALLERYDGVVPWPVRREFGNRIRALALRGWKAYEVRRG
jgi:hypothetical protein